MTRPAMTIERAREILWTATDGDVDLYVDSPFEVIEWEAGWSLAHLEGNFSAEKLEAIACVMRAGERKE